MDVCYRISYRLATKYDRASRIKKMTDEFRTMTTIQNITHIICSVGKKYYYVFTSTTTQLIKTNK